MISLILKIFKIILTVKFVGLVGPNILNSCRKNARVTEIMRIENAIKSSSKFLIRLQIQVNKYLNTNTTERISGKL